MFRLICTDSLARGIDIDRVSCVILYNVPKYPKNYIHRIGRTARAGHKGKAITFVIPEHVNYSLYFVYIFYIKLNCIILQKILFDKVLNSAGKTGIKNMNVDVSSLEQYEEIYIDALKSLKTELTVSQVCYNCCIVQFNNFILLF